MRIKNTFLRSIVAVKEAFQWAFRRLPPGFTIPLAVITVFYFLLLYPLLVYKFVPWLLNTPARWAHWLFEFGSVSQMGDVGAWVAAIYHHILYILASLLTLAITGAGVIFGYGLASFCYQQWRSLRRNATRSVSFPMVSPRKASSSGNGAGEIKNPLEDFDRIGIILAGGGA